MSPTQFTPEDVADLTVGVRRRDDDTTGFDPPRQEACGDPVLAAPETRGDRDLWVVPYRFGDAFLDGPGIIAEHHLDEPDRVLREVLVVLAVLPKSEPQSLPEFLRR